MKIVDATQIDGTKVEINPDAITEMVKVQDEESGFLFISPKEAEYEIHLNDRTTLRVDQYEHDKLKKID